MSELEYQAWWSLHRRVAIGESLSDTDRAAYDTGLQRLDGEETLPIAGEDGTTRSTLETRIAELEEEHTRLLAERNDLLSRVAELQARRRHHLVTAPAS